MKEVKMISWGRNSILIRIKRMKELLREAKEEKRHKHRHRHKHKHRHQTKGVSHYSSSEE